MEGQENERWMGILLYFKQGWKAKRYRYIFFTSLFLLLVGLATEPYSADASEVVLVISFSMFTVSSGLILNAGLPSIRDRFSIYHLLVVGFVGGGFVFLGLYIIGLFGVNPFCLFRTWSWDYCRTGVIE